MNLGESSPRGVPPSDVLDAFGVADRDGEELAGGAETSVRVGALVFKRVDDPDVAAWCQSVLSSLAPTDWTLPRPQSASDGRWIVAGWIATEFVDGLRPFTDDPRTVVEIGHDLALRLTDGAEGVLDPIRRRTDRWAIADRVAWAELDVASLSLQPEVLDLVQRLSTHLVEDDESATVVHGDLASNVFVDRSGVPVVLDVSPYVRPMRYGSAIVVVDHMLWFEGTSALRELVGDDLDALARAVLFRVVAHQLGLRSGVDHGLGEIIPIVDDLGL